MMLLMHAGIMAQSNGLLALEGQGQESSNRNYEPRTSLEAFDVTGQVRDENGEPFLGVTIILKGTTTGTTTDLNGSYTLEVVDGNSILVFSFVGYVTQETTVGNRTVINVDMEPDITALDEVVVTALGIEKSNKSIGYATTKVEAKELTINRTPNMMNSIYYYII
jgi:hypothetical protein